MIQDTKSNLPKWTVIDTHPDKLNDLLEGLSGINDPEMGYSIIQLGLIRNIEINPDHALVTMILTTPYCPYGPSMLEATRKKVESILGLSTKINYGSESWDTTMMEEGLMDDWGLYD
ncbi:MAG: iron-sulfur cluster assembly protein [Anaerolineaceae bacterium]|nr:iron-sulfur cluster assembly protein [Anaerolineaceae bacterium]